MQGVTDACPSQEKEEDDGCRGGQPDDEDTTSARMLRQLTKTKMCRFWPRCLNGDQCKFAHGDTEIRDRPNLIKTSLCTKWMAGACELESKDCIYAHGRADMRATEAFRQKPMEKRLDVELPQVESESPAAASVIPPPCTAPPLPHRLLSSSSATCAAEGIFEDPSSAAGQPTQLSSFTWQQDAVDDRRKVEIVGTATGRKFEGNAKVKSSTRVPKCGGEEPDTDNTQLWDGKNHGGQQHLRRLLPSDTTASGTSSAVHHRSFAQKLDVVAGVLEKDKMATGAEHNEGSELDTVPQAPDCGGENSGSTHKQRWCASESWKGHRPAATAQRPGVNIRQDNEDICLSCFNQFCCCSDSARKSMSRQSTTGTGVDDVASRAYCSETTERRTVERPVRGSVEEDPQEFPSSTGCDQYAGILKVIGVILENVGEGNIRTVTVTMRL